MHSTLGGRRWFPWQQHPCSDFPRLNWNILKYLLWAPLSQREMSGFPIPQACSWGEIFCEFDASEWRKSSLQAVKSPLSVFAKKQVSFLEPRGKERHKQRRLTYLTQQIAKDSILGCLHPHLSSAFPNTPSSINESPKKSIHIVSACNGERLGGK